MKVVFVQYGEDTLAAKLMVASCKKFGYTVIQLSDEIAPEVPRVDAIERRLVAEGHMLYRARRLAEVEPPYVMLDTDMLVASDISSIADGDHDVALSWRENGTILMRRGIDRIEFMPYNGGLVFVRNGDFMRDVVADMEKMEPALQEWYGDQIALRNVSRKYRVRELRDPTWNFVPEYMGDTIKGVKIYHFKGRRKRLMRFCCEAGENWCV